MDGVRVICRDFFDREFGPESFVAENDGFVFDQIDDAAEPVFGSERKLDRNRFGVKPATHHVHASLIVRAGTIHLVDESNAGNAIFIRLPPYGFRLGLDATHGAEYGDGAIQNILKFVVDRPRPDIHRLTGFSGSSFPSGHATAAAATFAVVALLLGRRRSRSVRNTLAGLAVGVSVLVAGTRVLLGVHWFTDVLAGMALGWAWAALCSIAFGGRLLHFGAPVEAAEEVARRTRMPGSRAG